jgi:hypothetical protein
MVVRMMARVEHADGSPAGGVALWFLDRALEPRERSAVRQKGPTCKTDAAGTCTTTLVYHYCKAVCPWHAPSQRDDAGRFEIVTVRNGKDQSLGFLQGVKRRGALLEGTLWARID